MHKNNHKLRIGIVGAGNIVSTRHLPALKKNPDVEIVAVSNSTYESSERFCRENSLLALPIRDWAELVATPDIDIIWIGTTPYMHSAVTVSALEAGKHVFCQARMSMDLAEAEEMLAASKRYPELVTMLCPPPFGLRGDLMVKKLLAENYIGQSHHVRLRSFNGNYLDPDAPAHWRQKIEISGLNTLTLGIYSAGLATSPACSRAEKSFNHFARLTALSFPICSRFCAPLKIVQKACSSSAELMRWTKGIDSRSTAIKGCWSIILRPLSCRREKSPIVNYTSSMFQRN